MAFIVLARNPHSNALMCLVEGIEDQPLGVIREFPSWEEADEAAGRNSAFNAWGYTIIETDIEEHAVAEELPEGLKINRYEDGGARIYFEKNGHRDLVMDLYDEEDGERREAIIGAILAANVLKPRAYK